MKIEFNFHGLEVVFNTDSRLVEDVRFPNEEPNLIVRKDHEDRWLDVVRLLHAERRSFKGVATVGLIALLNQQSALNVRVCAAADKEIRRLEAP